MRISDWSSDVCSSDLPVPHLGKLPIDWGQMGPVYKELILDEIERRLIPDIRSRIVTSFHCAPPDFAHDLRAHLGSAFSLEPTLTQSAFFRTHNRDDMIHNNSEERTGGKKSVGT